MKDKIMDSYDHGYNEGFEAGVQSMFKAGIFVNMDDNAWKDIKKTFKALVKLTEKNGRISK